MYEEVGIKTNLKFVTTFLPEDNKMGHYWCVYDGQVPIGWNFLETNEVKSVVRMKLEEVFDKIGSKPNLFTHGFLNVINEYKKIKHK